VDLLRGIENRTLGIMDTKTERGITGAGKKKWVGLGQVEGSKGLSGLTGRKIQNSHVTNLPTVIKFQGKHAKSECDHAR